MSPIGIQIQAPLLRQLSRPTLLSRHHFTMNPSAQRVPRDPEAFLGYNSARFSIRSGKFLIRADHGSPPSAVGSRSLWGVDRASADKPLFSGNYGQSSILSLRLLPVPRHRSSGAIRKIPSYSRVRILFVNICKQRNGSCDTRSSPRAPSILPGIHGEA